MMPPMKLEVGFLSSSCETLDAGMAPIAVWRSPQLSAPAGEYPSPRRYHIAHARYSRRHVLGWRTRDIVVMGRRLNMGARWRLQYQMKAEMQGYNLVMAKWYIKLIGSSNDYG